MSPKAYSHRPTFERAADTSCSRYPFERWIQYLLLTTKGTDQDVADRCGSEGFPVPPEEYVAMLRARIAGWRPPKVLTSSAGRTWLRLHRLYGLVLGTDAAKSAGAILHDLTLRKPLEALLVSGAEPAEAVGLIDRLIGRPLLVKQVEMYRHYFWDFRQMTQMDVHGFCEQYHGTTGARLRAYYGRGIPFTMWKLGFQGPLDHRQASEEVLVDSFFRFKELATHANGQDTALSAQLWTNQMYKSIEYLEGNGKGMEGAVEQLAHLALRLGRRDISSLEDLSNLVTIDVEKEP